MEVFTNLITPFNYEDKIDYEALDQHIQKLISNKNQSFIIGGEAGEGDSLTFWELKHLLRYICFHYDDIDFYVRIKESGTKKAIKQISNLKDIINLKGYIIEMPLINNLTQACLYKHLDLIASCCKKPIILKENNYNHLHTDTLLSLKKKHQNLNGLIINQNNDSYQIIRNHDLKLFINEKALKLNLKHCHDGIVSNLANLNYHKYHEMIQSKKPLDNDLFMLLNKYFYQENIASTIKYALYSNIDYKLRLPLIKIDDHLAASLSKLIALY